MRIIKRPDPKCCYNCGCIFEYDACDVKNDIQIKDGAFLGILPLARNCKTVECPVCKYRNIIQWNY